MNIVSVDNITKAYGERKLFDEASFFLQEGEKAGIIGERRIFDEADFFLEEGDKVGIIGINGTGKSTLLKMIAGLEEPDTGEIIRANGMVI